jgi:DNA replication protein DnaC
VNEAKRLQDNADLRQKVIRVDLIAGLARLSGVPERFREADFTNYRVDPGNGEAKAAALNLVNKFNELTGRGLILCGPIGIGKTHLGCAIINQLVRQGVSCRYIYAESFLEFWRHTGTSDAARILEYQALRALRDEQLIFLDDVGIGTDTVFTETQYTKLLDARYREKRPIVLATNLGLEDLGKVIGERCMSRLVESNEIVEIQGADRRME